MGERGRLPTTYYRRGKFPIACGVNPKYLLKFGKRGAFSNKCRLCDIRRINQEGSAVDAGPSSPVAGVVRKTTPGLRHLTSQLIERRFGEGSGDAGRYSRSFGSSAPLASPPCGE